MQSIGPGELQVKARSNGTVEITFKVDGREAIASLTPDQLSGLASYLLAAASTAFLQSGKSDEEAAKKFEGKITPPLIVSASAWHFGQTNVVGQRLLVARVGESAVAFAIAGDRMRSFGQLISRASWNVETALSARALCRLVIVDSLADLKAIGRIIGMRVAAAARRRTASLWLKATGRSLRLFQVVKIAAGIDLPDYDPIGKCIYCGTEIYSDKPGGRARPLGAEHIIAEGLDGKLELPEASCQKCEAITGSLVEGDILLRTLKSLRMHLKIRGKGKSSRPATLPLTITNVNANSVIQVPVEDYPVIFNMPAFSTPGLFVGANGGNQAVLGFRLVMLSYKPTDLLQKYGITSFASPYWDTHMFFRMLGKIGHSFAAAELGMSNFKPLLLDMILTGNPECFNHIGGDPDLARAPPSEYLHELGLGYWRANGKDYVVAKVRLFAKQMGPIYYVVVGESLETRMAKFSRIVFRKSFKRARVDV